MRLERVVPAVAIILFLSGIPSVASEGGESVTIVSPTEGATIGPRATVRLQYNASGPFASVSGYLTLDGAWAGSFSAPAFPGGTFTARLNATGFASGPYALGAVAFTNESAPVEAAPVGIVLDHPPAVSASATYDLDARVLRVDATVEDEGPDAPVVNLSEKNVSIQASFVGAQQLVLPIAHGPGNYTARLVATDAHGQNTTLTLPYAVVDRAATLELLEATYLVGGRLHVRATASDADGGIWRLRVATPLGSGNLTLENGTWVGNVPIDPRLGAHDALLVAEDAYRKPTTLPFTFVIGGEREIVYERVVETTAGAHTNADVTVYLPRVHNGTIEICLDACDDRSIYVWPRGAFVAAAIEARGTEGARTTCVAADHSTSCAFDTRYAGGWPLDLVWMQAGEIAVTVRVTGIRV